MSANRYTDITPDGLRVWCSSPESRHVEPPVVQFGADAPISLPVHGMQLRVSPDGSRAVLKGAYAPQDGACIVVTRGRDVRVVGVIAGDNAAGFAPDGRLVYCDSPITYRVEGEIGSRPMARTSQGFLSITQTSDGTLEPVWMDTHRTVTVDGITYGKPHACGGWLAGQAWDGTNRILLRTPDWSVLAREVYSPWQPRVSADGTVAVSLPGLFLTPADFGPYTQAARVPTLAPMGRPIWIAPGEVSGDPSDGGLGYTTAPGNAEVIWRRADLALRADPDKPFLGTSEVAATVTEEPCLGIIMHLSDGRADWGGPMATARREAARLGVPIYAYRDTGADIAGDLETLAALGVDRVLLQAYPRTGESAAHAYARIRANADACGSMLAGFVCALYTGSGAWPLQTVIDLLAFMHEEMRQRVALTWLCLWPWLGRPGRGGWEEHPDLRVMADALAASVTGRPVAPLPDVPQPPTPLPEPDPRPDPSALLTGHLIGAS